MARYVDADKVLKAFCGDCVSKRDWFCGSLCKIKEKIDSVPTEEVGNNDKIDSNEYSCCDCDHYRGVVDDIVCCSLYGSVSGCSCDSWEEIEDR